MYKLIKNENIKIFRQLSTYIMLGLMIVIVIIAAFFIKYNVGSSGVSSDWKAQLTKDNQNLQQEAATGRVRMNRADIEQQIKINDYRIQHNIPPTEDRTLWGFATGSSNLLQLIALFMIIVAGGIVASEYSSGTVKLLLIRPLKRWKILTSKYLSMLIFAFVSIVLLFIVSFIVGGIFFSFSGANQPYLAFTNGSVHEVNMLWHIITTYGYMCVDLLMMGTFAFMLSAVFRNVSLAVGVSLFLYMIGHMLVMLFRQFDWAKYILFANTNLTQYTDGTPIIKGMTLSFSLIILAVYFIAFNAISWAVFSKRDVAA